MKKITIQIHEELWNKLKAISKEDSESNPFYMRSQSQIAKMFIEGPLLKEYERYTSKDNKTK